MSKLVARITESEAEVMRIIWEAENMLTIGEIRKSLEITSKWEPSTIKTLLRRLCEKGVVKAIKKEVFYYEPLVSKVEYDDYVTQSLINRLYSGSAKNLIASLIGNKKINYSDIEELQKLFKVDDKNE